MASHMGPLFGVHRIVRSPGRHASAEADFDPVQGCKRRHRNSLALAAYSITLSARTSSEVGKVIPRVLAVFRLMTSSTLVACCTGRSAGLSPLRIRPT